MTRLAENAPQTLSSLDETPYGTSTLVTWNPPTSRSIFGDVVLIAFLLSQCLDGVLTYVGVTEFGSRAEANPLLATLMTHFGHGPAVVGAKSVTSLLGIGLHLGEIHRPLAVLAAFYFVVAVLPWVGMMFR